MRSCNYNPDATRDDGSCTSPCGDQSNSVTKSDAVPVVAGSVGVVAGLAAVVGIVVFLLVWSKCKQRRELSYAVQEDNDNESDVISNHPMQDVTSR